jgi:hypothetical protein
VEVLRSGLWGRGKARTRQGYPSTLEHVPRPDPVEKPGGFAGVMTRGNHMPACNDRPFM